MFFVDLKLVSAWVNEYQSGYIDYIQLQEELIEHLNTENVLIVRNESGVKIDTAMFYIVVRPTCTFIKTKGY